jgi:hypothetical protein
MGKTASLYFVLAVLVLGVLLSVGCSERTTWPSPTVVLEAVPTTVPPRIDGVALDREWYSAPELFIALSDRDGNQGGNFYLKMRCVYTPYPDTVYFAVQWADSTDDVLPDRLIYTGPEWHALDCEETDVLIETSSWTKFDFEVGKEDRFCIFFEITPVSDEAGTFSSRGCQVACHGGMSVPSGTFDAWYWMRGRTDPVQRCDDMKVDSTGFVPDQGEGIWRLNLRGDGYVPRYIARGDNGDLSPTKFIYDPGPYGRLLGACDTINPATLLVWNDYRDAELDYVPGYVVKPPTGSRSDLMTRSLWDEGKWTVEIKRAMRTDDPVADVWFYPDKTYNFAIAVMNGSGVIHSGSAPFVLKFRR